MLKVSELSQELPLSNIIVFTCLALWGFLSRSFLQTFPIHKRNNSMTVSAPTSRPCSPVRMQELLPLAASALRGVKHQHQHRKPPGPPPSHLARQAPHKPRTPYDTPSHLSNHPTRKSCCWSAGASCRRHTEPLTCSADT